MSVLVGVGIANATSNQDKAEHKTEVYVDTNTRIIAGGNFTMEARTQNQADGSARAKTGGLVGVAVADVDSTINYSTTATVKPNSDVLAGGLLRVSADSRTRQSTNANASGRASTLRPRT